MIVYLDNILIYNWSPKVFTKLETINWSQIYHNVIYYYDYYYFNSNNYNLHLYIMLVGRWMYERIK